MNRFEDFVPPLTDDERAQVKVWLEAGLTVEEVLVVLMTRRAAQTASEQALAATESHASINQAHGDPEEITEPLNGSAGSDA